MKGSRCQGDGAFKRLRKTWYFSSFRSRFAEIQGTGLLSAMRIEAHDRAPDQHRVDATSRERGHDDGSQLLAGRVAGYGRHNALLVRRGLRRCR